MTKANYKGYEVTLSDAKYENFTQKWRCIVYNKPARKQMGFNVFGGSLATMHPLEALYLHLDGACCYMDYAGDVRGIMNEFGYSSMTEAKKVYKLMEKAYYQFRKFGYTDDDIVNDWNELREEWG